MNAREPDAILSDNREMLKRKEDSARERRLALLWDRAPLLGEVTPEDLAGEEALSSLREEGKESLLPDERVTLARILARRAGLPERADGNALARLFPADGSEEGDDLIAYLRSSYTDRAYRLFGSLLPDPRAVYPTSFAAVCEEVYYNRARFCILPIENSEEGSLRSFRVLIAKYELKIVAVCDVPTSEEGVTRFALLHKNVRLPGKGEEVCFRFTFAVSPYDLPLDEVLGAMRGYGFTLRTVESVPLGYDDRAMGYDITGAVGEGDLFAFLTYLFCFVPQFDAVGVYPKVG